MLKLKIKVNLPQLLCIVVSVAQMAHFERFGGFWCSIWESGDSNFWVHKNRLGAS